MVPKSNLIDRSIVVRFLRYLLPYWPKELIVLFSGILGSVISLAFPLFMKFLIDDVIPNKNFDLLIPMFVVILVLYFIKILNSFFSGYLFAWISNHIIFDIRMSLFEHLMRLPYSFYTQNRGGEIVHRINDDCGVIQSALTSSIIRLINGSLRIIALAVALCWLNYKLFLICLLGIPLFYLNARYFHPRMKKFTRLIREKSAEILSILMENFENIKLIHSFNRQAFEVDKLRRHMKERIAINMKSYKYSSLSKNLGSIVVSFGPVLIFLLGGREVMLDRMSVGELVAFVQYLSHLIAPCKDLMNLYVELLHASVSMKRVFEFLDIPTKKVENSIKKRTFKKNIVFQDVIFKYNKNIILDRFNLTISQGKTYALVGPSGCGKSTVVNLLFGFYEQDKGTIYVDGLPLSTLDIVKFREHIGLVVQESQLFHDTIMNNLKYGNLKSASEEIKNIAETLGLSDFLDKQNKGLDVVVGDKGCKLSGGQRQRLAIARAILKDAEVLVLDEATSALDSESERDIFRNIRTKYKDKTVVIISHRLSTIIDVDEIICMDQGRVIEQGSHEELIEKEGYYYRLFRDQISRKVA